MRNPASFVVFQTCLSREEAYKLFRNSPFFGAWDPKVLELFVDHGLVAEDGGVRLKMPGLQVLVGSIFSGQNLNGYTERKASFL